MARIFLSYRKSDSLEVTGRLADALRARLGPDAVFWDERSLPAGEPWPEALREAVHGCDVLLAVIGPGWLGAVDEYSLRRIDQEEDWVRKEIETALSLGKRVIPVLVQGAKALSKAAKLAHCLEPLCDLQAVRLDSGAAFDYGFGKLLEVIPNAGVRDAVTTDRERELRYLARLIREEEARAARYLALSGAEARGTRVARRRSAADEADIALLSLRPGRGRSPARVTVDRFDDILKAFPRIERAALLGAPGAGKSTTLRKLAVDLARAAEAGKDQPLPLLVYLGNWAGEESLERFLAEQAPEIGGAVDALSRTKRLVFLLDGLNEMPTLGRRDKAAQVARLCDKLDPHTKVVVSCRLDDYTGDLDLGWDTLTLEPLTKPRVWEVLRHWLSGDADGEAAADRLFWQLAGDEGLAQAWQAWRAAGGSEEAFWAGPESGGFDVELARKVGWQHYDRWRVHLSDPSSLLALAENPFLLHMLFWVWEDEGQLPRNRGNLFQRFVDRLLSREGLLVKERTTGEWRRTTDGERLLNGLAELAWGLQRVRIAAGKEKCGDFGVLTVATRTEVLKCLDAGLLKKAVDGTLLEGDAEIRFRHQLLQEYFTAQALAVRMGGMEAAELWPARRCWERSGWEEAAVLLAGLYGEDNAAMIRWVAKAQPEVAARCMLDSGAEPADKEGALKELEAVWLPLLTDAKREPRPEARAAIGRAFGRLGRDRRKGVGLKDGIPDIDWVEIRGAEFYMARYPVTNGQYEAFVLAEDGYKNDRWWKGLTNPDRNGEPGAWNELNHPRETVSWHEAMAFCGWLSERVGYEVRLPTEEEWERAFGWREGRKYPWGRDYRVGNANVDETKDGIGPHDLGRTSPVGMYPQGASADGVQDLAGNVWEWCLREDDKPQRKQRREGVELRVTYRGAWSDPHDLIATGLGWPLDDRSNDIGFRVACASPIPAGR